MSNYIYVKHMAYRLFYMLQNVLHLCEAHWLPIILYASECFDFTITRKREVNSWWNSVYRKIFGYHKWESVRQLICLLERLDFLSLLEFRKFYFTKMLMGSGSTVINWLSNQCCIRTNWAKNVQTLNWKRPERIWNVNCIIN